eukprot:188413-Prymnesium_polylepis.1
MAAPPRASAQPASRGRPSHRTCAPPAARRGRLHAHGRRTHFEAGCHLLGRYAISCVASCLSLAAHSRASLVMRPSSRRHAQPSAAKKEGRAPSGGSSAPAKESSRERHERHERYRVFYEKEKAERAERKATASKKKDA